MLIICPECSHNVSDKASFCPGCGYPVNSPVLMNNGPGEENTSSQGHSKPVRSRKKHKKLPNGFGCIRRLPGRRNRPYAAYPPTTDYNDNGSPVTVLAIGYFADWYQAFDALREYQHNPYNIKLANITFEELYRLYYEAKYNNPKKTLSKQSAQSSNSAFKNCAALHKKKFKDLRKLDLQHVVDNCPLKYSSLELIVSLYHGMYKYALENDIVDKDYSKFVSINIPDDDEKGEPFTQEQIDILWKNKEKPGVDTVLIMIYTGFRISEYKKMEYNLEEKYLFGGIKTKAGKRRTVPIHPAVYDMIHKYDGKCFYDDQDKYRSCVFYPTMESLGIAKTPDGIKHTPHDCRHTFSWLCDHYHVDKFSKKLMIGHSLGNDVDESVYGHRTLEELRTEIEKIKIEKPAADT